MHTLKVRFASFLGCFLLPLCVSQLQAQTLTRTFISGLGSDTNPCSRALPCQTLSGALTNTASGGEIDILDGAELVPSGLLTISKSVSIIGAGARGGITGTLVASPPAGGVVLLKGLDINANGGLGIDVFSSAGLTLVIEDCTIVNGYTGIYFNPAAGTATSYLVVRNSTVSNNSAPCFACGGGTPLAGVVIQPQGTSPSVVVLDGVHANGNPFGVRALDFAKVTIRNSVLSQNAFSGVRADSATGAVTILVEHSQSSHNGGNGVIAVGTNAAIRISDVTITDNLANGVVTVSGGQIISFGNNSIDGNTVNGTPTSTIALK